MGRTPHGRCNGPIGFWWRGRTREECAEGCGEGRLGRGAARRLYCFGACGHVAAPSLSRRVFPHDSFTRLPTTSLSTHLFPAAFHDESRLHCPLAFLFEKDARPWRRRSIDGLSPSVSSPSNANHLSLILEEEAEARRRTRTRWCGRRGGRRGSPVPQKVAAVVVVVEC